MKHCVVVGGGLAGLAAALRLSNTGFSVTLCERAPSLGGRARSFIDRQSGLEIDNGQHVLMGCYRATLQYLAEAGIANPALRRLRGLGLPFVHIDGRRSLLQAGGLPHPFSLVQAFLRYDMLPLSERLRILRVAFRLRSLSLEARHRLDQMSASAWLRSCGQSEAGVDLFWRPVILATMNTEPESASAKLFIVVLRQIFLGPADAADMLLPEVGLSSLLVDPVRDALELREVCIRTGAPVTAVETMHENGRVRVSAVRCGNEIIAADTVISAVPPWAFARLEIISSDGFTDPLERSGKALDKAHADTSDLLPDMDISAFIPSEILSIHVWLQRDLGRAPMTGLLGGTLQWVFFKGKTDDGLFHYSCTVSAAHGDGSSNDGVLREQLLRELQMLDAELRDNDIIRILPIREKRATFVPKPGLEEMRPKSGTPIHGFFLAGDWTDTGLPATIEGAVRSGFSAAALVITNYELRMTNDERL